MKDKKYDVLCTEPDIKCSGCYKGYCISLENCKYQKPVLTNYERIKQMSVEEMAEYLHEHPILYLCDIICGSECKAISTLNETASQVCLKRIKEWFNSEVKNEDN